MKKYYIFITILSILTLIVLVFSIDNPWILHDQKADRYVVNQFDSLSYNISSYYSMYSKLPATLSEVSISSTTLKEFAETITYNIKSDYSYELCTQFLTESIITIVPGGSDKNHGKGYSCLSYKISDYNIRTTPTIIPTSTIKTSRYADISIIDYKISDTQLYLDRPINILPLIKNTSTVATATSIKIEFLVNNKIVKTYDLKSLPPDTVIGPYNVAYNLAFTEATQFIGKETKFEMRVTSDLDPNFDNDNLKITFNNVEKRQQYSICRDLDDGAVLDTVNHLPVCIGDIKESFSCLNTYGTSYIEGIKMNVEKCSKGCSNGSCNQ